MIQYCATEAVRIPKAPPTCTVELLDVLEGQPLGQCVGRGSHREEDWECEGLLVLCHGV